jgi:hypothetical protein
MAPTIPVRRRIGCPMLPAMPTPTTPEVSAPTAAPTPLPIATLIAYASPMVAVNFSLVLFMSYVNKYAVDVLLIPPLAMGLIFGAGRLWDAVTDPMAGVWSDRTEHAWGPATALDRRLGDSDRALGLDGLGAARIALDARADRLDDGRGLRVQPRDHDLLHPAPGPRCRALDRQPRRLPHLRLATGRGLRRHDRLPRLRHAGPDDGDRSPRPRHDLRDRLRRRRRPLDRDLGRPPAGARRQPPPRRLLERARSPATSGAIVIRESC